MYVPTKNFIKCRIIGLAKQCGVTVADIKDIMYELDQDEISKYSVDDELTYGGIHYIARKIK